MKKKPAKSPRHQPNQPKKTAQAIARDAARRYFAALERDIPYDEAPGGVELIDAAVDIHRAIRAATAAGRTKGEDYDIEDSALRAGYLLGVEIGKRLGGGR